jgi:ABC-type antimicrobial peptide transport system permease subunit
MPLFDIRTVEEELALEGWGQRFTGSLLAIVAGVALLLATIGIYAIAAYSASQRVREIGVRLALGALPRHIWWLVTRGASAQLAAGLTFGSAGAIAMSRVLPSDVTGPGGASLTPLVVVAALLTAVAAIALALPARRALRLNPATVLRAE